MSRTRSNARRCAMQALYQWHMTNQDVEEVVEQYRTEHDLAKVDIAYFEELLRQTVARVNELDGYIAPVLDRPVREVDPVEMAILRLSTYELVGHLDVPYRVVINEAVELAKTFGAANGHKYVNGILDKLATSLRAQEVAEKKTAIKSKNQSSARV